MKYYKHAETLFLQDNLSVDEICKNLNVSRRTLFYWREKYEWDKKKAAKFAKKEAFSKELQGFVEKLMAKITTGMQNKKPVNQSEFYSLINILKYIPEAKRYENLITEPHKSKPTGQLSPEIMRQIEKDIFGLE